MRSKAHFRGDPIHPALVHFPIAFLIGAFGFDLVGRVFDTPALWRTGAYLAATGIVTAVIAAVPGFIDYFFTVPPASSAKRRATKHMLLNLAAVGCFAAGWVIRGGTIIQPEPGVLVLEGLGTIALIIAAYLGGVLVSRNQIGVDHRYAGAGRWSEERLATKSPLVVAQASELLVDQMKLLVVDGRRIVLARTEEGYTAFDDRCTHRGASLADGVMIGGTVQCPWHGSQFDVRTGAVCGGPAQAPIRAYQVEQRGSDIVLELEATAPARPRGRLQPRAVTRASPGTLR